jgi:hypothetical protein
MQPLAPSEIIRARRDGQALAADLVHVAAAAG